MFQANKFLLLLVVFLPGLAFAAPFCVTTQGLTPDCIYDDTTSCRARANQVRGVCTVNASEILTSYGQEKYCLVDSSRVPQCIYIDRSSCESAANSGSVCVNNSFQNVNEIQPDPYQNDPNRNY